jgi:hypothetical protein
MPEWVGLVRTARRQDDTGRALVAINPARLIRSGRRGLAVKDHDGVAMLTSLYPPRSGEDYLSYSYASSYGPTLLVTQYQSGSRCRAERAEGLDRENQI